MSDKGVAIGAYTHIYAISVSPPQPSPGDEVWVRVDIRNLSTNYQNVYSTGWVYGKYIEPTLPEVAYVPPGGITSYVYKFIMQNQDATFWTWSWWWTGSQWQLDDTQSQIIALVPTPQFAGFDLIDYSKV